MQLSSFLPVRVPTSTATDAKCAGEWCIAPALDTQRSDKHTHFISAGSATPTATSIAATPRHKAPVIAACWPAEHAVNGSLHRRLPGLYDQQRLARGRGTVLTSAKQGHRAAMLTRHGMPVGTRHTAAGAVLSPGPLQRHRRAAAPAVGLPNTQPLACIPLLMPRAVHWRQGQLRQQTSQHLQPVCASSSDIGDSDPELLQPIPAVASEPKKTSGFLPGLYKSLRDFGIGKGSMTEGGLGLFIAIGAGLAVALVAWAKGSALRTGRPYHANFEFPLACGITVGTPVRIRGVAVGSVLNVKPSLDRVDVMVEINDASTAIPRNSVIEANQSGLIAEPLVDITPQKPIPTYTASPLDPDCWEEGAIVCNNGHIRGQQGVALDDMVYVMTKMARQLDAEGLDKVLGAAEAATGALEEATPLLQQASLLLEEMTPLLQELREGGLVGHLEHLTEAAANAAADIQSLQKAVMTDDNVKALRSAVLTLCKTLEHVEAISSDAALFSRDKGVQRNLKTLIQALSRIVDE